MKLFQKRIRTLTLLLLSFCLLSGSAYPVKASVEDDFQSVIDAIRYNKGDKQYTKSQIAKGKKHLTKSTYKKHGMTQYQIVKISKGKITLRPQQGMYQSADPYFKKKTLTYKISSKCKFYYRDVTYPSLQKYKWISKSSVLKYIKHPYLKSNYSYIYDYENNRSKKKYYVSGYFGDIYMKNGKVVAVITDHGA